MFPREVHQRTSSVINITCRTNAICGDRMNCFTPETGDISQAQYVLRQLVPRRLDVNECRMYVGLKIYVWTNRCNTCGREMHIVCWI